MQACTAAGSQATAGEMAEGGQGRPAGPGHCSSGCDQDDTDIKTLFSAIISAY